MSLSQDVAQSDENRANPALTNDIAPSESAPTLRHDPTVAIAFLKWLDPQGRHNLWALHPETGAKAGQTFRMGDWRAIQKFIEHHPAHNIYFSANEPIGGAPDKKLRGSEIESVRCAFIDCDPPADLEQAGKQAEARDTALENAKRAFTSGGALIDSGGGFQVIWRLKEKLSAKTDGTKLEDQNRGLTALFEGDKAVTDFPRVLRLPGTVNWPDEAKRKRGRIPRRSSVQYRLPADGGLDKVSLPRLAEVAPPVQAPAKGARDGRVDEHYPFVDMELLKPINTYDDLPQALRERFEARCEVDIVLRNLFDGKLAPWQRDETGSGFALALAGSLKAAGNFTPLDFGMLLMVWPDGPDTTKLDQRYIGRTWERASFQPTPLDSTAGFEGKIEGIPTHGVPWDEPANLWAKTSKPPELPHGVVPELVEKLARDKGRRLGVEPGAVAAALITTLGSLVPAQNKLQMRQFDTEWTVHPILWLALIAASGKNKSATLSYAAGPVEHVEERWRAEYAAARREAETRKALSSKNRDPGAAAADTSPIEATPEVQCRQKLVNDATTEAIGPLLEENPTGLLYFADELSGWINSMDAYRQQKGGKDRAFWLQAKDGRPYTINRKTGNRRRIVIPALGVSVLGGIQPDKIRPIAADLDDDGLLQRFMPILLDRQGKGVDAAPDIKLKAALNALAVSLTESEQSALFKFAPEAAAELDAIEDFKAREINRPDISSAFSEWLDKLPSEFGRVALIFHFIEHHASHREDNWPSTPTFIPPETARRARRFLTKFVFPHAQAFHGQVLGHSAVYEHAAWVAGYILTHRKETVVARELYRAYGPFKRQERQDALQSAMATLDMLGWVRATGHGKRGATKWDVNSAVNDGRFAERAHIERVRRADVRTAIANSGADRHEAA